MMTGRYGPPTDGGLFDSVNPREGTNHAVNWLIARLSELHPLLGDPKPGFLVVRVERSLSLLAGFVRSVPVLVY